MDPLTVFFLMLLAAALIYGLGNSFIDRVFERQEEIINQMTKKGDV